MSITEKLTVINDIKNDIKAAIENRGVSMTNVTFPEYASKIKLITDETVLYNSGSWNSEYSHANYIPSGGSITENDTYISIVGGGAVPQIGFTLKDSDIDRTFYALVKPALYSSSAGVNYRFGVGYQNTAVTSSSGGTTVADTTSIPHNARCIAGPMIISIPVRSKYAKIFVAGSQTCKIYKMWLGKKYTSISAGDEVVTGVQFLPISNAWDYSKHVSTSGTSDFEFYNPTFVVSGTLKNGDSFDVAGSVDIEAYNASTGVWDVLYTYQTGDVYAGSSRSFSFTYTHSSSTTYTRWRVRKHNASNKGTVSTAYISSYTKKKAWVGNTGSLITMTSNSTNGYTASASGWSSGSAWYAFNGSASDKNLLATNNPNETASNQPTNPHVKLMFPEPIRIAEIQSWIGYGAEAVSKSRWFHIYGIKEDGTEVDLGTNSSGDTWANLVNNSNVDNAKRIHTVSAENQEIPFVGIVARRASSGAGYYRLAEIKITKWYS